MARRIGALLPEGWFGDVAPVLSSLLQGVGTAWANVYGLIVFVTQQTRVAKATGQFLDMISTDFFGALLPRLGSEQDSGFRVRITDELLRPRSTRAALILGLTQLTGRPPVIFEPSLSNDTGGYSLGGLGYTVAGGWGSLALPFQVFITAYRPQASGIPLLAGYGSGGVPVYGSLDMEPPQILDADIFAAVPPLLPVATIGWTRISS